MWCLWLALLSLLLNGVGCATIRVTDTPRTADEEFLLTQAASRAVARLSLDALRGRSVWLTTEYAFSTTRPFEQSFLTDEVRSPQFENSYLVAELRSRLLEIGARLAGARDKSDIVLEVRTGALAVNRSDYLLGIPALALGGTASTSLNNLAVATPNLALYQNIKQDGYASVAVVGYWRNTGEVVVNSGPFVGHTHRYDFFIFGYQLEPQGDIPPTQLGSGK
jgi:hypothetical protein